MSDLLFLTDVIDSVEMNTSFDPIPAGTYPMNIIGAVTKDTKAGNGKFIELTLEVASGPHTGRRIWERLNVQNPNPTTQEIAQKAVKTLKVICGIDRLVSSDQFLGHQVPVKVELKPRKDDPLTLENRVSFPPPKVGEAAPMARPAAPQGRPTPAYAAPQQTVAAAASPAPAWRTRTTVAV